MILTKVLSQKFRVLGHALRPLYASSIHPAYHTRPDCPGWRAKTRSSRCSPGCRGRTLCARCANAAAWAAVGRAGSVGFMRA